MQTKLLLFVNFIIATSRLTQCRAVCVEINICMRHSERYKERKKIGSRIEPCGPPSHGCNGSDNYPEIKKFVIDQQIRTKSVHICVSGSIS